ncbi:2-hydroxy-3-keto-5-methylthiopentenyl-1-phosphate phosphatase [Fictibacillus gelatini]|uniref:2-hydroxy-3-keto-5-methylthiopentenyl-1- phosphate phosphatase n=1 Tax=Fictibacillus gelatini TaxID=225985 RepID=UPI0004146B30|nr:2-hydroxy-3-keto-5-methylthiopentenyl-1-phosphate phosphatase [Fictibacillus gelatini]
MKKTGVIFCDFDGTVTENDNIIAIMKQFAPLGWENIKEQILGQQISIREGVGKLFSLLPSSKKDEITEFVLSQAKVRDGFHAFVDYTKEQGIPLYIVSGGIDFFVYPLLQGVIPEDHIYCNGSDFTGESVRILWPHACDDACGNDCGCCKPTILRRFDSSKYHKIVIGDSITDLQAAKQADEVFARDFLIEKCEENNISYTPFETFYEIIDQLSKRRLTYEHF